MKDSKASRTLNKPSPAIWPCTSRGLGTACIIHHPSIKQPDRAECVNVHCDEPALQPQVDSQRLSPDPLRLVSLRSQPRYNEGQDMGDVTLSKNLPTHPSALGEGNFPSLCYTKRIDLV